MAGVFEDRFCHLEPILSHVDAAQIVTEWKSKCSDTCSEMGVEIVVQQKVILLK